MVDLLQEKACAALDAGCMLPATDTLQRFQRCSIDGIQNKKGGSISMLSGCVLAACWLCAGWPLADCWLTGTLRACYMPIPAA